DKLNRVDAGFDARGVLTFIVSLPAARYPELGRATAAQRQLVERLQAAPGVTAVALSNTLPLQGVGYWSFGIEGAPPPAADAMQDVQPLTVSPGYFDALGIRALRGRVLEPGDVDGTQPVAVVNEQMVRQYFAGRDPIGARVTF